MSLYARSDVCSVSIPVESGGCGASHSREVTRGVPAKVWKLECPACESVLRGEGRPQKLVYEVDKASGRTIRQQRVPDADPLWSSVPDTIPFTPDEERTNSFRQERGSQQIQMIQALAALRATGIDLPSEALWLLERELPAGMLHGTVVCANGHDVQAGLKFCGECGITMAAKGALEGGGDEDDDDGAVPADLSRLHVATLRKMCRDHEPPLPDKGSKDELIQRLAA